MFCIIVKITYGGGGIDKITVIYRGYDNRKLEIDNEKIVHETQLPLSKFDVFNLFISTYLCKKSNPFLCFASPELKKINEILKNASAIIISPSGANIGIYQDERLLGLLVLAIRKKLRPIFCYCTIGRSKSRLFNFISKFALRKSALYLREKRSMEYARKIGAKAEFGIDRAFYFQPDRSFGIPTDIKGLFIGDNKPIVLILTELHNWHPDFRGKYDDVTALNDCIIPAIENLANKYKKDIVLLPHIIGETERIFLCSIIEAVSKEIGERIYLADINSVYEYDNIINGAEIVVTMRYHGVVISAKNGVPFLAIAYENKMLEVSRYVNCAENCIFIADLIKDNSLFEQKLNYCYDHSNEIKDKLFEFRNKYGIK